MTITEREEQLTFIRRAKTFFETREQGYSYGDLTPGSYLALRWGLDNDCIKLLKLDESFQIELYEQAIDRKVII